MSHDIIGSDAAFRNRDWIGRSLTSAGKASMSRITEDEKTKRSHVLPKTPKVYSSWSRVPEYEKAG